MQCPKCGNILSKNDNFCNNCGESIKKENIELINEDANNNEILEEKQKGDKLAIISLVLYFISPCFSLLFKFLPDKLYNTINTIGSLCTMVGIVTLIVGRVKYPQNKFLKIVMWVFIILIILGIIGMLLFMLTCYLTCTSLDLGSMNTAGCY